VFRPGVPVKKAAQQKKVTQFCARQKATKPNLGHDGGKSFGKEKEREKLTAERKATGLNTASKGE